MYFKSGIGNLIAATPAMQALTSMEPDGRIDVCLDAGWNHDDRIPAIYEILNTLPFVGKVKKYPGDEIDKYKKWFFPVQCEPSTLSQTVMTKTKQHWPHIGWRKDMLHEVDANMDIARSLGYAETTVPLKAITLAEGPGIDFPRPIIGLCNGAFNAPMWKKKHWPFFGPLADTMRLYFGASVIGVGGPGELEGVKLKHDYCGELSITESAKVIDQCDIFITTDTGCMHIADALDIPQIALFGATIASKNAPLSKSAKVLKSPIACAPCQYEERFHSCTHAGCMEAIVVGEVVHWVEKILNKRGR